MKTKPLIEQHFHGAFGIDFNTAGVEDILYLSREIKKYGIGGIFPTIVTDTVENTRKAVSVIKEAASRQTSDMAKIFGVHLEGIFLNPKKKGIHDDKLFLAPTIENFRLIEDDFIKIVTLAPELIINENQDENLISYLAEKNIKIQAGHCIGGDLRGCNGVTHMFNAMEGISHRGKSTALSALINDNIYTEIIADGVHVSDEALKLLFKTKPLDKIILISDCLPCTEYRKAYLNSSFFDPLHRCSTTVSKTTCSNTLSDKNIEFQFAGETIYYDGKRAVSKAGTIAGSTSLLPDIIKRLVKNGLFNPYWINNPYKYHNINLDYEIEWDENWNLIKTEY